jgi:hypothetical protein
VTATEPIAGVRLRLRRLPLRTAVGIALTLPALWLFVRTAAMLVSALRVPERLGAAIFTFGAGFFWPVVLLWLAQYLFNQEEAVTLEGRSLVLRSRSWVGPNIKRQIGLDRVRGHEFSTVTFPKDAVDPDFRPGLRPRLILNGDGSMLMYLGATLTAGEARQACEALNRFIAAPIESPEGVNDLEF